MTRIADKQGKMLIVLGLCLLLRLSFFAAFQPWQPQTEKLHVIGFHYLGYATDSLGYHQLATSLLRSKSFSYEENGKPDALRTPGYPLFVAAVYHVFGSAPWVVMMFQIVFDTASCLFLMLILAKLFTQRIAFVSSLFYALDPFLVFYCSTLLSDILYVFLVVLSFYVFSFAHRSPPGGKGTLYYALFGFIMGIATLVRPVSVYIPILIVFFFFTVYWRDKGRAVRLTAVCLIPFFMAISPWLLRNFATFDRLSLSTAGQFNLLYSWAAPMEMERLNVDHAMIVKLLDEEVEKEIMADGLDPHSLSNFQLAEYHQRLGVRKILKDPLKFAKTYTNGIIFNFINLNTEGFTRHLYMQNSGVHKPSWYSSTKDMLDDFISRKPLGAFVIGGLILLFLAITYSLTIAGLVVSWRRFDRRILFFLLLMASYFILLTGALGGCRYKLPSIPFYLCFAGIGFEYVYLKIFLHRKNVCLDPKP